MAKNQKPVYVTQPSLPPLDEFVNSLEDIWDSKWLTNNGKYHREFEQALASYLGVPYVSLFSNGTMALISALQVLRITGEVITTPFSFVATTHALWWNNIKPVFVDIEPNFFNLDPAKVEAAISPKTTAILPVHVYGSPCQVDRFQNLADVYGLKIIYDAAHAFGVKLHNRTILDYGDISVLSFHATKVFNTIEGGAIVCHDKKTKERIDFLKNFGFANETTVVAPGINAKMNELQAAYGLLQLKYFEGEVVKRRRIAERYKAELENIEGLSMLPQMPGLSHCHSYFPILIEHEYGISRDSLYEVLKSNNIYGRRYFYPLISQFPSYKGLPSSKPENLPVAERVAKNVLCLPIFSDLGIGTVNEICQIIKNQCSGKVK